MINIKYKILNGTCPRTPERTAKGQQKDTNNNDNNIFIYLFKIYKGKIFGKKFGEKVKLINQCKNEEQYMQLTEEEQDRLFNELMRIK